MFSPQATIMIQHMGADIGTLLGTKFDVDFYDAKLTSLLHLMSSISHTHASMQLKDLSTGGVFPSAQRYM